MQILLSTYSSSARRTSHTSKLPVSGCGFDVSRMFQPETRLRLEDSSMSEGSTTMKAGRRISNAGASFRDRQAKLQASRTQRKQKVPWCSGVRRHRTKQRCERSERQDADCINRMHGPETADTHQGPKSCKCVLRCELSSLGRIVPALCICSCRPVELRNA